MAAWLFDGIRRWSRKPRSVRNRYVGNQCPLLALSGRFEEGRTLSAFPLFSDVYLLRNSQCVVYFDAQEPDGALDLGMSAQKLNRPQIARAAIDQVFLVRRNE